jgi:adenine deaminase
MESWLPRNGKSFIKSVPEEMFNNFNATKKSVKDFEIDGGNENLRVIEAINGQIITQETHLPAKSVNGKLVSNTDNDVLKITVVERYKNGKPAIAVHKKFRIEKRRDRLMCCS